MDPVAALQSLKQRQFQSHPKDIRRRLKTDDDRERLMEKMSTVRVAHRFLTVGFTVEFETKVKVADYRGRLADKVPDLQLIDSDNGQEIIVEVSHMESNDQQRLIERTFHKVWGLLIRVGVRLIIELAILRT